LPSRNGEAFAELQATGDAAPLSHPEWLGLRSKASSATGATSDGSSPALREAAPQCRRRGYRLSHPARSRSRRAPATHRRSWIDAHDNLILTGPTGVGKSWLASALGHRACRDNRSVLYQRVPKLFGELALARGDGVTPDSCAPRQPPTADPRRLGARAPHAGARRDLLEILEERYGRRSTIVTSQIPVDRCMRSSTILPTPTPSWTASSTTPTASSSPARACDASDQSNSKGIDPNSRSCHKIVVSKAPITGRHHPGIPSDMISETVGDIIGIRKGTAVAPRLGQPHPHIVVRKHLQLRWRRPSEGFPGSVLRTRNTQPGPPIPESVVHRFGAQISPALLLRILSRLQHSARAPSSTPNSRVPKRPSNGVTASSCGASATAA